ncbi:MAG: RHS repeat-associated core domain-containing protein [Oscillospiraceae bacterium]|jgi:RHS repeat-associated protein|nr:RHS repeat-associated core domain-containing protein [Oscillospiraceae bacterium]
MIGCTAVTNTAYWYSYLKNPMGDVVGIINKDLTLAATYEYDAWGKVLAVHDANGNIDTNPNSIGNLNPLRYRGYFWDVETGFYYCGARYYDPNVGRFINADGVGAAAAAPGSALHGKNLYAYCENNPVNCFDPTGKETTAIHW